MKKYLFISLPAIIILFLLFIATARAGMMYAPGSFCSLKAEIISINQPRNISFKVLDVIGLSPKFYQDFPYEKSISDKDCKRYYNSNNVTQASTSQKNLTGIKSGDTVKIDIYATGDEWGTNYVIDNIEQDSLAKIDFTGIKSEAIYLAVILALLLVILYLVFNKSRKKII